MSEIDDIMFEDDVSIAAQLKERMLESDLIDEINLGGREFVELANFLVSNQESEMTESEKLDVEAGLVDWSQEYDSYISNPPKDGDILEASTPDAGVLLVVELKEDNPPFIYGKAYVPEIVGHPLGWFLQDPSSQNYHGWKCILLPRARTELIRKFGLQSEEMVVKSLRVVRPSQSGKSLLCEVHEYFPEDASVEEPVTEAVTEAVAVAEAEAVAVAEAEAVAHEPLAVEPEVEESKVEEPAAQEPEVSLN